MQHFLFFIHWVLYGFLNLRSASEQQQIRKLIKIFHWPLVYVS